MQILHYFPGGECKPYFDSFVAGSRHLDFGGNRMLTLILYLNDVPLGGWTEFARLETSVVPYHGTGVMFKNLNDQRLQLETSLHG